MSASLNDEVTTVLNGLVESAQNTFKEALVSIILYGSAAESALRVTSDVNTIFVLNSFQKTEADKFRDTFRLAHAAIHLNTMFLLRSEIPEVVYAFPVKFADIFSRNSILYGENPFDGIQIDAQALLYNVNQTILNLQLRLRESYVLKSLREEKLTLMIADTVGPLRSIAASLLLLEDRPAPSPKVALEEIIEETKDKSLIKALEAIRSIRENATLKPNTGEKIFMQVLSIIELLHHRFSLLETNDEDAPLE